MDDFVGRLAEIEGNVVEIKDEVEGVLDELVTTAQKNDHFKMRLVKWDETGSDQHFRWLLEMGVFSISFNLQEVINYIEPEKDESGYVVPSNTIDISKVANAVKRIVKEKMSV